MLHRRSICMTLLTALVLTVVFTIPFTRSVQAQIQTDPAPEGNDNCIKCHEDLYFLHDTGNWYCIRESPMTCTGCHGGNPTSLNQEEAHTNRAAHPVINEDISKCRQCHPEECYERVDIFKQEAGLSNVLVAVPYAPAHAAGGPVLQPVQVPQEQPSDSWINLLDALPILILAGSALLVHGVYRFHHRRRKGS